MATLKLYMLVLGGTPVGRHTEQHDIFFGIAATLKDLVPEMLSFWPEAEHDLHVDAWREVTSVDGYRISVEKIENRPQPKEEQLFFINLGGYQQGVFDEQHYKMLTVQVDKAMAVNKAKATSFYKQVRFPGANSHIDDHYGVDIDEIYKVADILPMEQKERYVINITKAENIQEDELHLGYFKLSALP